MARINRSHLGCFGVIVAMVKARLLVIAPLCTGWWINKTCCPAFGKMLLFKPGINCTYISKLNPSLVG